jgi:hypothetical protein
MKSLRLLSLAFPFLLALRAGDAAGQTPVFLLDTDEATFVSILRVEPATGQLTPLGALPGDQGPIVALAAATENLLYAVAQNGEVLAISVSPFGFVSLGNIGQNSIVGLAFGEDGLYAIDEGTSSLYRIEVSPPSIALVGPVRFPDGTFLGIGGGDLAQSGAGDWFLWTNATQALYRLNVADATVTAVPAQVTGLGFLTGLAFDYQGGDALLGSSGEFDALQTLDPASGVPLGGVTLCVACPTPYDAIFGDLASPAPGLPCPQQKGFWRNDPAAWPVDSLTLGIQVYGEASLMSLLDMNVMADASLNLGHQLIAAKLSVAAGSDPAPVAASIAQADAQLAAFPGLLPYRVRPNSPAGRAMLATASVLADYNEGVLTPFCAP